MRKFYASVVGATISSDVIGTAVRPKGDEPHSILPLHIVWGGIMEHVDMAVHRNPLEIDMMTIEMDLFDCSGNLSQEIISLLRTSFNPKWIIGRLPNGWCIFMLVIHSVSMWFGALDESNLQVIWIWEINSVLRCRNRTHWDRLAPWEVDGCGSTILPPSYD